MGVSTFETAEYEFLATTVALIDGSTIRQSVPRPSRAVHGRCQHYGMDSEAGGPSLYAWLYLPRCPH